MSGWVAGGDVCRLLGLTPQQLQVARGRGLPCRRRGRGYQYEPAEVREWFKRGGNGGAALDGPAEQLATGRKVRQAREQVRIDRERRKLAQLETLSKLGLRERIEACETFADLQRESQHIAGLVSEGVVPPDVASVLQRLLGEARQNIRCHEASGGDDTDDGLILCCEDAAEVARIFEGIVCDKRRARVLAHVKREAAKDLAQHPNTDPGEADA